MLLRLTSNHSNRGLSRRSREGEGWRPDPVGTGSSPSTPEKREGHKASPLPEKTRNFLQGRHVFSIETD